MTDVTHDDSIILAQPDSEPDGLIIGNRIQAPPLESTSRTWADRALWIAVGMGLLWWSWQLIGDSYEPWTVLFLVGGNLWGLATITVNLLPDNRWSSNQALTNRWAWATVFVTIAVFGAWSVVGLLNGLTYGTDAIAFNQYAARLVQHGLNPYTHSMRPAFQLFHTPTSYYTYSFTGVPVTTLSYPSLSFLIYVPFLMIGWWNNVAPWLNMFAWGLTVVMMFALLPRRVRALAVLFGGFGLFTVFAMGGVTDAMFMPLLTLTAYRWDRFGRGGWRDYVGPIAFGLAMGIKQTPWPALPFILLALACDEYALTGIEQAIRRAARYLAVVLVTFLIPNIPWIIASPSGWIKGTLTPLFANMVPTGQGSMSLSLYLHWGGGSMSAFTLTMVFGFLFLFILFVGTYPTLRLAIFMLPGFALFFAARSNVNYFISLIPAAVMAAATASAAPARVRASGARSVERAGQLLAGRGPVGSLPATWRTVLVRIAGDGRLFRNQQWAIAALVSVVLFLGFMVHSLTAAAPFNVRVLGAHTTGVTNRIEQLVVRVDNTSGKPITPSFDLMQGGFNSTFWIKVGGPTSLAAHSHAIYRIDAPNVGAEPSAYGGFNVVGYVDKPESFSVAATYEPHLLSLGFQPDAINQPMPLGKSFKITVQLYAVNGGISHRSGVEVRLSELIWGAFGPRKGGARVDGGKVGKGSVGITNSNGQATFTITGARADPYPVSFSAVAYSRNLNYVFGSSGDLNIRFVNPAK